MKVRQVHGHGHEEALHVVVRQEALTSGLLPANVGKTQRRGVASVWAELRNRGKLYSRVNVYCTGTCLKQNNTAGAKEKVDMGVTRKFSREGHNFQPKMFCSLFCTKSLKTAIFAISFIFGPKLGAFKTYKMKKIVDFSRAGGKKGKISRFFDVLD